MIPTFWDGKAFTPLSEFWVRRASAEFGIGETADADRHTERSKRSHDHFFASVAEAWENLPEHLVELCPSPEHLRKFALIRAGYADGSTFVCSSKAEALRLAAFLKPVDPFSVVSVSGATVTRFVAQSQSMRAMGKQEFQRSKDKVLDVIAAMIGTDAPTLQREAGQAA